MAKQRNCISQCVREAHEGDGHRTLPFFAKAFLWRSDEVSVILLLLITESLSKVKARIIGLSAEFGLLCHDTLGM